MDITKFYHDCITRVLESHRVIIVSLYKVEEALSAAVDHENMKLFSDLLGVLSHPFDEDAGDETYAAPGPVSAIPYQTFCGT